MNNLSLYELIKKTSQQKARPLKILTDWDDCLFPFRTAVVYNFYNGKKSFKEFFDEFWENVMGEPDEPSPKRKFIYIGTGELKIAYDKFEELHKERSRSSNKDADKYKKLYMVDSQYILSTAEELLRCLKEGLISELKIITASYVTNKNQASATRTKQKRKRFARTFGKFPQCSFEITEVKKVGDRNKPHRWEWIRDNYPDFDIFIDDSDWWIVSVRKNFPNDKIYATNDYKYSRNAVGDNIYHVKTIVSDLKDEDFAKAAEEYKQKQTANLTSRTTSALNIRERERERLKAASALLRFSRRSSDCFIRMRNFLNIK